MPGCQRRPRGGGAGTWSYRPHIQRGIEKATALKTTARQGLAGVSCIRRSDLLRCWSTFPFHNPNLADLPESVDTRGLIARRAERCRKNFSTTGWSALIASLSG